MPRTFEPNTPEEEAAVQRGIASDPDNAEWNADDFTQARPASELVPKLARDAVRRRGPGTKSAKVQVTLRLDRDVVDRLRASGQGWQVRANQALRRLVGG